MHLSHSKPNGSYLFGDPGPLKGPGNFRDLIVGSFLAVQNSSIGLNVGPSVCPSVTTNNQSLHNTTE